MTTLFFDEAVIDEFKRRVIPVLSARAVRSAEPPAEFLQRLLADRPQLWTVEVQRPPVGGVYAVDFRGQGAPEIHDARVHAPELPPKFQGRRAVRVLGLYGRTAWRQPLDGDAAPAGPPGRTRSLCCHAARRRFSPTSYPERIVFSRWACGPTRSCRCPCCCSVRGGRSPWNRGGSPSPRCSGTDSASGRRAASAGARAASRATSAAARASSSRLAPAASAAAPAASPCRAAAAAEAAGTPAAASASAVTAPAS